MLATIKRVVLGSRDETYHYLLVALVVFIGAAPFLPRSTRLAWIDDYLLVVVLLAAVHNVSQNRRLLWIGAALGLPAVISRLAYAHITEMPTAWAVFVAATTIAFLGFLVTVVMHDVLRGQRHIGEKVTGAIVAYLLIGLTWTFIYGLIDSLEPGSFAISEAITAWRDAHPGQPAMSIFHYYSFVTLTTLGYGDVSPISETARTLSWIEAVIGQLFIAVTIARLVGMHAATMSHDPKREPGAESET